MNTLAHSILPLIWRVLPLIWCNWTSHYPIPSLQINFFIYFCTIY